MGKYVWFSEIELLRKRASRHAMLGKGKVIWACTSYESWKLYIKETQKTTFFYVGEREKTAIIVV